MIHESKITGKKYEIGELIDPSAPKDRNRMDIIFILDQDEDGVTPIGWYWGEYNFDITEDYIRNYENK